MYRYATINPMYVFVVKLIFIISIISIIAFGSSIMLFSSFSNIAYGIQKQKVHDSNLKVETVYDGLEYPTSMTFIGSDDILVTEKDKGTLQRIVNGQKIDKPLLDVPVANENERGLLGVIFKKSEDGHSYLYLYFTESNNNKDGNDYCPEITSCEDGKDPKGNRLYRYEFDDEDNRLKNAQLLLDLPATPGSDHMGGALLLDPDDNVYLTGGDGSISSSLTSNVYNETLPDGRGGILKVLKNNSVLKYHNGIIGDKYPLNLYYAYGIRNSFGLDFDPVTGNLWDTENGRDFGDEINLVKPGFNSGWNKVQGIWETHGDIAGKIFRNPEDSLVEFNGKGKYSSPEFVWNIPVGVTALKFFDSDKLGKKYENDLFVADIHNGNVYHFDLNKKRTGLSLDGRLADKVADYKEDSTLVFASGFHGITDIEVGPDGYLYLLSFYNTIGDDRHHYYGTGGIYRVVPVNNNNNSNSNSNNR